MSWRHFWEMLIIFVVYMTALTGIIVGSMKWMGAI